jgi:hypothetical protein
MKDLKVVEAELLQLANDKVLPVLLLFLLQAKNPLFGF